MIEYVLEAPIGDKGGFGEVYSAVKTLNGEKTDDNFAVKILRRKEGDSKDRFKKEVRILKNLNHPRIVRVLDYNLENEDPFYVMHRYGGSMKSYLNEIIGDYNKIEVVFNQIFDGVEYLHNEGIYHRDLKPANILMNSLTDLVINDFGLGLNIESSSERLTETGRGMGTWAYTSPEQMNDSKHIDHRTDIYSLGKMIYEAVVGEVGISVDLNKLPSGLKYVVSKCIKNNPEDRYDKIVSLRSAFNSSIALMLRGIEVNDFNSIVDKIISTNDIKITSELVNKLRMIDLSVNKDKVHEMIMKLPIDAIKEMYIIDEELTLDIINIYVKYITSQYWSFNYTDTIGYRCKIIYDVVSSIEIKSKIVYCVAEVGITHNRWDVLRTLNKMLQDVTDLDLAFAIVNELETLDKNKLRRKEIQTDKIHPIIASWIEDEETEVV